MIFTWVILPLLAFLLMGIYIGYNVLQGVRFFGRNLDRKKQRVITAVISIILVVPAINVYGVWFIALLHVAVLLLLCHLIFGVTKRIIGNKLPMIVEGIYRSGVIAAVITIVIFSYGYHNMHHIVRTGYQISTEKAIRSEGYRLVVLSDLHYGISLDNEELSEVAERISNENPDAVILDGDIVDENTTVMQIQDAFAILGSISSKYGIYYVYGNHDTSNYSNAPLYSVEQLDSVIRQAGIRILDDSTAEINDDLVLIGRADKGDGDRDRKGIDDLVSQLDSKKEWIVLDHQPIEYAQVEQAGADMIISGHTHAGQIWPAGTLSKLFRINELNYGHKKIGDMDAIVTAGIAGWGYPIRTEKHSEYIVIDIQPQIQK